MQKTWNLSRSIVEIWQDVVQVLYEEPRAGGLERKFPWGRNHLLEVAGLCSADFKVCF